MSRIPLSRVFVKTPYSRLGNIDVLSNNVIANKDGLSALDKIRLSERARLEQKGGINNATDELGARIVDHKTIRKHLFRTFLVIWGVSLGLENYIRSKNDVCPVSISDRCSAVGSDTNHAAPDNSDNTTAPEIAYDIFSIPSGLGWYTASRPLQIFNVGLLRSAIDSGGLTRLLSDACDPFLSEVQQSHLVGTVAEIVAFPSAVKYIYRRFGIGESDKLQTTTVRDEASCSVPPCYAAQNVPIEYARQYKLPQSRGEMMSRLFADIDWREVPENVASPLCKVWWPILRLGVIDSQLTYDELLSFVGYPVGPKLVGRSVGRKHFHNNNVMRAILSIVSATPKHNKKPVLSCLFLFASKNREVPLIFMQALINTNRADHDRNTKGHEYRAHIVRLLLENRENALKVFDAEAIVFTTRQPMNLTPSKTPIDQQPIQFVLDYLYTPINEALGPNVDGVRKLAIGSINQTQDIHAQSIHLINAAVQERALRHGLAGTWMLPCPAYMTTRFGSSLDTAVRRSYYSYVGALAFNLGAITSSISTGCKAPLSIVSYPQAKEAIICVVLQSALVGLRNLVGWLILEQIYSAEIHLVNSDEVFSSAAAVSVGIGAALLPINAAILGKSISMCKWGTLAFFLSRCGMDSIFDRYRKLTVD